MRQRRKWQRQGGESSWWPPGSVSQTGPPGSILYSNNFFGPTPHAEDCKISFMDIIPPVAVQVCRVGNRGARIYWSHFWWISICGVPSHGTYVPDWVVTHLTLSHLIRFFQEVFLGRWVSMFLNSKFNVPKSKLTRSTLWRLEFWKLRPLI